MKDLRYRLAMIDSSRTTEPSVGSTNPWVEVVTETQRWTRNHTCYCCSELWSACTANWWHVQQNRFTNGLLSPLSLYLQTGSYGEKVENDVNNEKRIDNEEIEIKREGRLWIERAESDAIRNNEGTIGGEAERHQRPDGQKARTTVWSWVDYKAAQSTQNNEKEVKNASTHCLTNI